MPKIPHTPPHTKGFTLIELLTVIAIIGVLAGILIPTMGKVRQNAKNTRCVANLRQIGPLLELYKQDHNGSYPSPGIKQGDAGWKMWDSEDLARYIGRGKSQIESGDDNETGTIWECPAAEHDLINKGVEVNNNRNGYGLNKALPSNPVWIDGKKQGPHSAAIAPLKFEFPARTALAMDAQHAIAGPAGNSFKAVTDAATRHGGSINVLFADLSVRSISQEELPDPNNPEGSLFWTGQK
ncbi:MULTISPECIES: type II secretion system protein [unclassified Lentimonas]|uniref:type II secretion system protein n=1 Tax=unclassified Lentimonas TaxID=2630993 RepID=UPI00132478BB|nr:MULTISPECIES: prepilin-type N-terminal cleavage/methylation domain-containing protein [unclassified Lentimonas]CAA6680167.1 Unannotated [Lentimonas sp. CC4]CAA6687395.1 Unannotated [Lentimonas sp. CC6]CAA6689455.1 Unannotated [Lentimonas sp. CC10]CAA6696437.1 Unannotated [Lentimonas sp. CC19]CAA7070519.1 Unannotated [Lentimonas sp. CC11]